jgi:hypothetical protein
VQAFFSRWEKRKRHLEELQVFKNASGLNAVYRAATNCFFNTFTSATNFSTMTTSYSYRYCLMPLLFLSIVLFSCKKDYQPIGTVEPPVTPTKKVLLKDIIIPRLPSPYYHFEYNADSLVTKADFDSGLAIYDVLYNGNKISEMRDNIIVNHDTLRYVYDNAGKLAMLKFINDDNEMYRQVLFTYNGNHITKIEWDRKAAILGFQIDRTLSFTYFSDGNVKTITEHRTAAAGGTDDISVRTFDQYDDKINVDDFSLIHDGIHDHLFLPQGFRLQKNNPKKETLAVNGVDYYTIDYTYTYNNDQTPSDKAGDFLYLSGQQAGQLIHINTFYTYY